jgi:carboxymethylenebutenolidase
MKSKLTLLFSLFTFSLLAQDYSLAQLENSPRHHEWVKVANGTRNVQCFVAYPETKKKVPVVIVIHENRGLTDWVRSFADQLAAAGYIAIAPDLLSDFDEIRKKTTDFATSDDARQGIYELKPEVVTADLNAVQAYGAALKAGNGKTVVAGFCWGGSQSFRFATNNQKIAAALVFYGGAPKEAEELNRITVPVYGFYGGEDARVNAGIPDTELVLKASGKTFDYVIYEGAGHAYMRSGDNPAETGPNKTARDQSWERIKKILSGI